MPRTIKFKAWQVIQQVNFEVDEAGNSEIRGIREDFILKNTNYITEARISSN